ncbi:SDR family NAD(P)-dependent oxidoreductase [Amycolatopsis sp. NPDC005232]|uniref:SDR family NAD(P)-dependent oxidoreductase n=1 Tax=Amycolatopsis sp. NPDC005232 TaxID=3157027 RepID=UPI0033B8917B
MKAVRRWFVTGASRGLGRALTEVVLDRGDRVVAAVRRPESVADLEQKYGSQIEVEQLDVSDLPAIDEVLGRVLARGPLDVVVNNAGFGVIGALEDQSPELVQSQLTTMLHAPIAITRAVLPALREHGGGHIFQISSIGGQMAFPGNTVYNAVKWGLEGFSESLAQDVAQFGIRVTIVEPGAIRTDFHHAASFPAGNPAYQEGAVAAVRGYFRPRPLPGRPRQGRRRDPRSQHPGEPAAAGSAGQRRLRRVVRHAAEPPRRPRAAGDARPVRGHRPGAGRILSHRVRSAAPAPTPW